MNNYVIKLCHPRFGDLQYCAFSSAENLEGEVLFGGPVETVKVISKVMDEGIYNILRSEDTWNNVLGWINEKGGVKPQPRDTVYIKTGEKPVQFEMIRATLKVFIAAKY